MSVALQNYLQTSVMQLNQQLAALTEQYPSTHPGATVLTYSIAELFSNVTTDPAMYGFMDVTNPTYQVSSPNSWHAQNSSCKRGHRLVPSLAGMVNGQARPQCEAT